MKYVLLLFSLLSLFFGLFYLYKARFVFRFTHIDGSAELLLFPLLLFMLSGFFYWLYRKLSRRRQNIAQQNKP